MAIPKIIHYCWFGGNPKSELILRCMDSWRRYFPDYEIREWNEDSFDIHACDYVREAYEAKKWAFVSDYCRMHVLYTHGGLYFDTDVEIVRDARELFASPVIGFESKKLLNPGLVLACEAGDAFCRDMLDEYATDHFTLPDGTYNYRTICDRATDHFVRYGMRVDNTLQQVAGYTVYPTEYFNPLGSSGGYLRITENTVSVHNFAGSWIDEEAKRTMKTSFKGKVFHALERILGKKLSAKLRRFYKKHSS